MGRIPQPPAAAYIEGTGANQGNSHNKIPFFPVYMLSFVCLSSPSSSDFQNISSMQSFGESSSFPCLS